MKQMDETIKDTIRDILIDKLHADPDDINDFTDIMDDLGADSLDVIEMLMAIEEDFGVNIPDEDLIELHTFRDVCDYIERNM